MKRTKILALLIALITTMSTITGCGGVENTAAILPTEEEVAEIVNTEGSSQAIVEDETEAIVEDETEIIAEDETSTESTDNVAASTSSQKTTKSASDTSTAPKSTPTGSQDTSAQDTPVTLEPAQTTPVASEPAQTTPAVSEPAQTTPVASEPVQTTPAHEHVWKERNYERYREWVPNVVTIPDYEYFCDCGFTTTDYKTMSNHWESHFDENGVSQYDYTWVETGTHEEDLGSYRIYGGRERYCDCGAVEKIY